MEKEPTNTPIKVLKSNKTLTKENGKIMKRVELESKFIQDMVNTLAIGRQDKGMVRVSSLTQTKTFTLATGAMVVKMVRAHTFLKLQG